MGLGPVVFKLRLFEDDADQRRSQTAVLWLLEALVQIDLTWLRTHPETPALYKAKVRYDITLNALWKDIPTVMDEAIGDCKDLACWRIAELKNAGLAGVRPYIRWRQRPGGGGYTYHVLVRLPDGRVEDPSIAMGMMGPMPRKPIFRDPDTSLET